ncbi:ATP-dependent zinc metalloprotease FtsH [Bacteroidota bacterium]|jgi:cell division protease FtsH|nr:ATP-dependent zinc metalloprotease FtsH [Bacteroidota bacterium]MEC7858899.1 ATP-dependent zinc metalloprotease FtsH [Pseudomonadota bacterium]MEC8152743.1 ATP-dependent zinc metalloprotease FtsH [Pseudomonadota bacterium]|tara:strand:+ start:4427 stop:6328 length:1902 start_codon:yes stop_codon:yes gene_type:complete
MKNIGKNLFFWLIAGTFLFMMLDNFSRSNPVEELTYSEFKQEVQSKKVKSIVYKGDQMTVEGERLDGTKFSTKKPVYVRDDMLDESLREADVAVSYEALDKPSIWSQLLVGAFPLLLLLGIFFLFMRQMQGGVGGKGGPMTFGRSKAKLLDGGHVKTNFNDVAGCEEAKDDVKELVDFLKDPAKFIKVGGKIPRGILMVGPPGTGKTLLARAVAGEAKVPFFTISGSDFVEMFVGVGASRVRDMFEQAKKHSPCIVFIDEIDAVGRQRGAGLGGGHDEREQTLNQLLVEMDGFEENLGVIVIAATNRPDVLDAALLRPGRFDRQVMVGLPDIKGREQILNVHLKKVPVDKSVEAEVIARGTPGFSGADLANLVNEAALLAARKGQKKVNHDMLDYAKDKIMMGAERKSMILNEDTKKLTAYHEAGHAIVGLKMPEHHPVYKVTIIPRGGALGVTMFLPEEDTYMSSKTAIISQITSLFGGRVAEEIIYGSDGITTGASSDIERASELARNMVTKWGFSEKLGTIKFDDEDENPFLGRTAGNKKRIFSEETAKQIDKEVKEIIQTCYEKAAEILTKNLDKLHGMADALLKYETIDQDQISDIMAGALPRDKSDNQSNSKPKSKPSTSSKPVQDS